MTKSIIADKLPPSLSLQDFMLIAKDETKMPFRIRSFEPGKLLVNEQTYTNSVIIYQKTLEPDWKPQQFTDLKPEHFKHLENSGQKLIIVGTGERQQFPHISLYAKLLTEGIVLEFMSTKKACHTFNILMAENRQAACALLLR